MTIKTWRSVGYDKDGDGDIDVDDLRLLSDADVLNIRRTLMEWLEQRAGRDAIVRIHVEGIKGYVKRYQE